MKIIFISALLPFSVGLANTFCFGSGAFTTCNDASGNSYNVQRYGNTTEMQGYNAVTGSSWTKNLFLRKLVSWR